MATRYFIGTVEQCSGEYPATIAFRFKIDNPTANAWEYLNRLAAAWYGEDALDSNEGGENGVYYFNGFSVSVTGDHLQEIDGATWGRLGLLTDLTNLDFEKERVAA